MDEETAAPVEREDENSPEVLRERYQELLQELRVILPAVQVLFAFLLTAPFAARFGDIDATERRGFAIALGASLLSMVILMTPVAYHGLTDRHNRRRRIRVGIRLKMLGLGVLGFAVTSASYVVVHFIFGATEAAVAAAAAAASYGLFWVALPLLLGGPRRT